MVQSKYLFGLEIVLLGLQIHLKLHYWVKMNIGGEGSGSDSSL